MKSASMPRRSSFLGCFALVVLALLAGCADRRNAVAVNATTGAAPTKANGTPLTPEQVAKGLDDLTTRIRERVNQASDRMDEGASNTIRRRTLRFRMRTSEVAWRAVQNPNHLAGLVELWLWMSVVDEFAKRPQLAEMLGGERVKVLQELGGHLHADVEAFARQALPAKGFASIKASIDQAAANGELLTASPQREQAIIGDLLEVTRLQTVLGYALSPFEALRGVGSGSDSLAAMTVTANRAVDLMARYPEIVAWNLRLAVIDIEEQDAARETRAALQQALKLIETMPARIRAETATLLEATGPAQEQAQKTLREVTAATEALVKLNAGLQPTLAAIERLSPPPDPKAPPKEPGRPFDIREYTAAIEAATVATREARQAIEAAADKGAPVLAATATRFEAATDRLFWRIAGLIALAAALAAGLIVLWHRLKRSG